MAYEVCVVSRLRTIGNNPKRFLTHAICADIVSYVVGDVPAGISRESRVVQMVKLSWFLVLVRLERRFVEFRQVQQADIRQCRKQRVNVWAQWRSLRESIRDSLAIVASLSPHSDYSPERTDDCQPVESWVVEHNAELEQSAIDKSRHWRKARLARIKHLHSVRKLEKLTAKYHRQTATPIESPVTTLASHPLPAIKLQGEDTTEPEIQELLSTIRDDDRRADVAAQCWIVRADHPSAPALHVFHRAVRDCQMVAKGVYSRHERHYSRLSASRIADEKVRHQSPADAMRMRAVEYWESSLEECNRQERMELALTIAKSKLGEPLLQEFLSGRSKQEIADSMGISLPTLYRRLTALDVFKPDSVQWSTERNSVFLRVD